MADNKKYYYLKLKEDFFDSDEMLLLQGMKDEQCEKFVETLDKYQQFTDIRNVGAAVHSMIDAANEKMDDAGFDPDMDWTYLAKVFGSAAIPVESAEVIKKALKKAEKDGTITSKNKWQMIEYWAADYLAGK